MRTDKGDWLGGLFGEESYASGYPEEPQDILLEQTYRLSADGEFLTDAKGEFESLGSRLLVRWQKVDFLEVFPIVGFEEE